MKLRVRLHPVCVVVFLAALTGLAELLFHTDFQDNLYASDHPWIIPLYFFCSWISITGIIGLLSGWPILASRYFAILRANGERTFGGVRGVGLIPENNITGLTASGTGAYHWTSWPFALFRAPLLIPWQDITLVERGGWAIFKSFTLRTPSGIDITLSKKGFQILRDFIASNPETAQGACVSSETSRSST